MRSTIIGILVIGIMISQPLLFAQPHTPSDICTMKEVKGADIDFASEAEVYLFSFTPGECSYRKKTVSIPEALTFLTSIDTDLTGLQERYKKLHAEDVVIPSQYRYGKLSCLRDQSMMNTPIISPRIDTAQASAGGYNILCSLQFRALGLGLVVGTHTMVPTVGADLLGLFAGFGTIDMSGGFLDDVHLSGLHLWGYIGYVGNLIFTFIPFIPGPIIVANGFALASFAL